MESQQAQIRENAALVVIAASTDTRETTDREVEELKLLSLTAGLKVLDCYEQKRKHPHTAYYAGRGKLLDIKEDLEEKDIDVVIFNQELSPVQTRNIENLLEIKVLDRTALILDIFARRARSWEGKLQVELAQLQYLLTRLTGYGKSLSRLGGGIGTRGPGETKLETDRRRIRKRISDLKRMITEVKKHRQVHRSRRKKEGYPTVSLVGYTNAGKSSLLNALTGESILAEDMLFATLDPTVRKIYLDTNDPVLLTDTVGFIHNLPSQLLNAFKATLEEINEADLIIHLVDISHPDFWQQMDTVEEILEDLLETSPPKLLVFNKIDRLGENGDHLNKLKRDYPDSVFISVKEGSGLEDLKYNIYRMLSLRHQRARFAIPYQEMSFLNKLYQNTRVMEVSYTGDDIKVEAETDPAFLKQYPRFVVSVSNT